MFTYIIELILIALYFSCRIYIKLYLVLLDSGFTPFSKYFIMKIITVFMRLSEKFHWKLGGNQVTSDCFHSKQNYQIYLIPFGKHNIPLEEMAKARNPHTLISIVLFF